MPELPEVQTTASKLNELLPGLKIISVWSDYSSSVYKDQIKSKKYFTAFEKSVLGAEIKNVGRRAKNVLIHLSNNKTILVHMKMTGHLLYGSYQRSENSKQIPEIWQKEKWIPSENKESLL